MQEVAILGVGQVPVREHWDLSVRHLAVDAGRAAMADADVDKVDGIFVSNMTSGRLNKQRHLGALVADHLGQRGYHHPGDGCGCRDRFMDSLGHDNRNWARQHSGDRRSGAGHLAYSYLDYGRW